MDQFQAIYFEECAELLDLCESYLMKLENNEASIEDIHAIFRCIHTIKGGAGTFGFSELIEFAHTFETLLDKLREQTITLNPELIKLLLKGNDIIGDLVAYHKGEGVFNKDSAHKIRLQMNHYLDDGSSLASTPHDHLLEVDDSLKIFHIIFKPHTQMMHFGNEPLYIIRALENLSCQEDDLNALKKEEDISTHSPFSITCVLNSIPSLEILVPQDAYIQWDITLCTHTSYEEICEIFEFVEDDCDLSIKQINKTPQNDSPTDSFLANDTICGQSAKETSESSSGQKEVQNTIKSETKSIRVELDRIDRLVNTVGEMVIKQAMVIDQATLLNDEEELQKQKDILSKSLHELSQHTRDLQESVMAIRAQPIRTVFSRFPRLVRELSESLGKEVILETYGENTEIDKTVIERLGEPLTHMIRNSIDHGIENKEDRIASGKSPHGTLKLNAEHRSGRIVIEIIDDGQGINRKSVLKKAIANGIVAKDQTLSDEDIDQLIFHPGFSTASEVTNVSGRGVGMDVVKRSIQSLGGRVGIQSEEGKGCRFSLTLPLTLAVMDGMIISCGKELYVIPIIHILETIKAQEEHIQKLVGNTDLLHIRKETVPLIYLSKCFNIQSNTHASNSIILILETEGGEKFGLMVDDILGQQQVVLKSLEVNYEPIQGVSAATILGNGHVALILDIGAIRHMEKPLNPIYRTFSPTQAPIALPA